MKKSLITFLNNPKRAITITVIMATIIGAYAYRDVGHAPRITNITLDNASLVAKPLSSNFLEGQEINLAFPKGGRVSTVYVKTGDSVHKGQMLAALASGDVEGAVSQATAALELAKANYEKVLNGATTSDIDIYKQAVTKAKTNLDQVTTGQDTLVRNAYANLLNSTPEALPQSGATDYTAPSISGTYTLGKEGSIHISVYSTGSGPMFTLSGLVSDTGTVTSTTPQPLGNSGLYIKFPSASSNLLITDWVISIPNKKAANYLTNYNAYQSALSTQSQAISAATADLNTATVNLTSKESAARPEDVAIARAQVENASGALQIAEGTYSNNLITAPADGFVTVVNIHPGEIAVGNQKALGMIVKINK